MWWLIVWLGNGVGCLKKGKLVSMMNTVIVSWLWSRQFGKKKLVQKIKENHYFTISSLFVKLCDVSCPVIYNNVTNKGGYWWLPPVSCIWRSISNSRDLRLMMNCRQTLMNGTKHRWHTFFNTEINNGATILRMCWSQCWLCRDEMKQFVSFGCNNFFFIFDGLKKKFETETYYLKKNGPIIISLIHWCIYSTEHWCIVSLKH